MSGDIVQHFPRTTIKTRELLRLADEAAVRGWLSVLSTAQIVAAYQPIGDYATGAEGDLASSAVQPGDNVSDLVNDAGFITFAALSPYATTASLGTAAAADTDDFAAATHNHAASGINSGTFDDARISEANVTQHQAALSITESQISDLGTYLTASAIGVTVQAYDADTAKLDLAQTWSASQIPGSAAITFASSITDDLDVGPMVKSLTLTGDVTAFAVSNGSNYQIRRYYILQDGTGSHTITFSGIDGTEPTIDDAANALTVFEIELVPATGARFV